jgi:hypothetical protein
VNEGDRVRLKADGRAGTITGTAERDGRVFYYVEFDGASPRVQNPGATDGPNRSSLGRSCAADELEPLS